ncbi:MAG: hypothetical protein BWZ10_01419 [candidate division BRC1 bacterium ADurb.BinA364]|nr:MAG: hypothetical protein BWZ10_01419 [candidate division BRC1 bacterium ADurb.BinA364]
MADRSGLDSRPANDERHADAALVEPLLGRTQRVIVGQPDRGRRLRRIAARVRFAFRGLDAVQMLQIQRIVFVVRRAAVVGAPEHIGLPGDSQRIDLVQHLADPLVQFVEHRRELLRAVAFRLALPTVFFQRVGAILYLEMDGVIADLQIEGPRLASLALHEIERALREAQSQFRIVQRLGSDIGQPIRALAAHAAAGRVAGFSVAFVVARIFRRGEHVLAPLAEVRADIVRINGLESLGDRQMIGRNEVVALELRAALARRRHAAEHGAARRSADRRRSVAAGEAHAGFRQARHARRLEIGAAGLRNLGPHRDRRFGPPLIVGENEDDVGPFRRGGARRPNSPRSRGAQDTSEKLAAANLLAHTNPFRKKSDGFWTAAFNSSRDNTLSAGALNRKETEMGRNVYRRLQRQNLQHAEKRFAGAIRPSHAGNRAAHCRRVSKAPGDSRSSQAARAQRSIAVPSPYSHIPKLAKNRHVK